jgi:hypothetical protein
MNGTNMHNVSPNGQLSKTIRAILNGMFITVISRSETAKLPINKFVAVLELLRSKTTLQTNKFPINETITISE